MGNQIGFVIIAILFKYWKVWAILVPTLLIVFGAWLGFNLGAE